MTAQQNTITHKTIKVGMISLGCPKNLVDSEAMLGLLVENGFAITPNADDADAIIINTCGFIGDAKQESIDTILEMVDKKLGKCRFLIVTGCLSERYAESFAEELPEVDAVLGTGDYSRIAAVIKSLFDGGKGYDGGALFRKKSISMCSREERLAHLNTPRVLSAAGGYAYVKIAEGCDNYCSYCVIPSLRGPYASRKITGIVKEISALTSEAPKEIVLVAQDVTRYGKDIYGEYRLSDLIEEISVLENVKWIRLLYCYPDLIDDRLIRTFDKNKKLLKYLDIPIQHSVTRILQSMGRRYDKKLLRELICQLRAMVPEIVLRTTLITGFPGEVEADFEDLKEFVADNKFERLGVFAYSSEEGTSAALMQDQVGPRVAAKRRMELIRMQQEIAGKKDRDRVGRVYEAIACVPVLDKASAAGSVRKRGVVKGAMPHSVIAVDNAYNRNAADEPPSQPTPEYKVRTYAEAPEIDGTIRITAAKGIKPGSFINIRITGYDRKGLQGVIADETDKAMDDDSDNDR